MNNFTCIFFFFLFCPIGMDKEINPHVQHGFTFFILVCLYTILDFIIRDYDKIYFVIYCIYCNFLIMRFWLLGN